MISSQLAVAIQLARMYGVAETLEPLEQTDMLDFVEIIAVWSEEYIKTGRSVSNLDTLLEFFETKLQEVKEKHI